MLDATSPLGRDKVTGQGGVRPDTAPGADPLHRPDEVRWAGVQESTGLMQRPAGLPPGHPHVDVGTIPDECPASHILNLSQPELTSIAQKKATCPFIGSVVNAGSVPNEGALPVRNEAGNPLASIEDVRRLGNTGGGDLGDLLVMFAQGNHGFMRGDGPGLSQAVPSGLFSLDFPGSQGSHPGHSGILQGDPRQLDSGRLNMDNFQRLADRANPEGLIKLSDVGKFIAENMLRDPNSKVFQGRVAGLLGHDLVAFARTTGPALLTKLTGPKDEAEATHRDLEEKLTKILGEDNLIGSAGEFGLLFAFLAHKPDAQKIDGEPTVSVADLKSMFVDKKLPEGWQTWKKTRLDWVTDTTRLLVSAGKAYAQTTGHMYLHRPVESLES